MSEEKFGIENLKKVVKFGVDLSAGLKSALADGKITLDEVFGLLPQFMQVPALIQSKDAIINEARDLSLDEVKELVDGLDGATTENVVGIIEDTLNFLVSGKNLVERFIGKAA